MWLMSDERMAARLDIAFFIVCFAGLAGLLLDVDHPGRVETAGQLILVVSLLSLLLGVWLAHVWLDYVLKPGW
jgi:hypothetical protein